MLAFYATIVGRALVLLVAEGRRITIATIVVAVVVALNRLFAIVDPTWEAVSPWWALVPIAALLLCGIVVAAWRGFEELQETLRGAREDVRRLQGLLAEGRERRAVAVQLTRLEESGERLRQDILADEDDVHLDEWDRRWHAWRLQLRGYLHERLSPMRAAYVDTSETYDALSLVRDGRPAAEARAMIVQNIDGRLRRLREIVAETEAVLQDLTRTPARPH